MARQKNEEAALHQNESLVSMTKNGEMLDVHPTCVKAHEIAGWVVVSEEAQE